MAHIYGLCILNLFIPFYSALFSIFLFLCVHGCPRNELEALLGFKAGVSDSNEKLKSWEGYECCTWRGVECDDAEMGSPVSKLDLHDFKLTTQNGGLHDVSWFLELKHLKYLDLGGNIISVRSPLPPGLGSLTNLTYLDISNSYVRACTRITRCRRDTASIDVELSNVSLAWLASLSSLKYLSLNNVDLKNVEDNWVSIIGNLSQLEHLDLSGCNLRGSTIPVSRELKFLTYIDLSSNQLTGRIPFLWHMPTQFRRSLSYLNLRDNQLEGDIPPSLGFHINLSYVDLSSNSLSGQIPRSFGNLSSLVSLQLHDNELSGSLPLSFAKLNSLTYLDVSNNQLSGSLPLSFAKLISLTYLNVSNNQLNESIPFSLSLPPSLQELYLSSNEMVIGVPVSDQILFQKTSKMTLLDLADSGLSIYISSTWIPPFQLQYLSFRGCNIGGPIPGWISTQFRLETLDLTETEHVGNLPSWLWEFSAELTTLHLSDSHLEGPFTPSLSGLRELDLSMNELSGSLVADIDKHLLSVHALLLADNKFEGKIPASVGNMSSLGVLDLSGNLFTGNVPASLGGLPQLYVLRLENNTLDGEIPKELGNLIVLESFRIGKNKLQGLLPPTLSSLSQLRVFDVGENNFTGDIPDWIAEFSNLQVLVMRSNNFKGKLPPQMGQMPSLQILDLSSNLLSGEIPDAYLNFTAMNQVNQTVSKLGDDRFSDISMYYMDGLELKIKGENWSYEYVLSSLTSIDLSNNRLWGPLPPGIGNLKGLISLNLNKNNFTGPIPDSVRNLEQLELLDLSVNNFSGHIPSQLGFLDYLGYLNLSYNNLSGRIPLEGRHMITFDNSSYLGNPNLWGCPLERKCSHPHPQLSPPSAIDDEEEPNEGFPWYWMSFGLSVGMGFSGVVMVLTLNVRWKNKCFQLMDSAIAALFAKLLNW